MSKQQKWKKVRGTWISTTQIAPGIWRRKEGGHAVRARIKDPRTGRQAEIWKVLPEADLAAALRWLQNARESVREGRVAAPPSRLHFATYAVSLLKQKVAAGDIRSRAGIDKWDSVLQRVIRSRIGEFYVDAIQPRDVMALRSDMALLIQSKKYSPHTMNTDLAVLKVILRHAMIDFGLPSNPARAIPSFDTSQCRTFTREQPNSLTVVELASFLAEMRSRFPHFYAMTFTGFCTGQRPSALRPLRRKGQTPDVLWGESTLLFRRSNSRGDTVMLGTKTGRDEAISVPQELMDVLTWHVDTQLRPGPQLESDLLFPSETGGFRSRSALDKPFAAVAKAIGLTKRITPKGMRRTFQDLCRAAEVRDVVTRSICGHATETMQQHYSTVSGVEQAESLAKVIHLIERRIGAPQSATQSAPTTPASGEVGGEGAVVSGEDPSVDDRETA